MCPVHFDLQCSKPLRGFHAAIYTKKRSDSYTFVPLQFVSSYNMKAVYYAHQLPTYTGEFSYHRMSKQRSVHSLNHINKVIDL